MPPASSSGQQPQPGQAAEASLQPASAGAEAAGGEQQQQQGPVVAQPEGEQAGAEGGLTAPPPHTTIMDPMYAFQWLDENGLMVYVPDPLKVRAARP